MTIMPKSVCSRKNLVYAHNFRPGLVWLPGVVVQVCGRISYSVKLGNGITVRRQVDHLQEHTASAGVLGVDNPLSFAPVNDGTNDIADATVPDLLPTTAAENSNTEPEPLSTSSASFNTST